MTTMALLRFPVLFLAFLAAGGPAAPQALSQVLPELTSKRLLNDLQVTVASTPHLGDGMTIGLAVRYGATFDPADKSGLGYVVSQLLGKATIDRTAKALEDELTYTGSNLDIRCDWDGFRFVLNGPGASFERLLLLLYQVVGEAVFNESDLVQVKSDILKRLSREEDPRQRIHRQFEEILFGGTSYGRSLQGNRASIQGITLGDVRLFHRRYFSPNAAALVIVGSSPPPVVLQKASRIWGVWVRREEIPFTFMQPRKPAARNIYLEDDPSSPAAQFILGNLWPRRDDPSYYPATLAARILQERLTKALPTSLITVGSEGRRMTGPLFLQGQAAADQAKEQIQKLLDIVDNFSSAGVTKEELTALQARWIEEFSRGNATPSGICAALLDSELYRLGTNYMGSFADTVRRVGPDSVRDASREWLFPGGVVIVVRGPAATLKAALESMGAVHSISP